MDCGEEGGKSVRRAWQAFNEGNEGHKGFYRTDWGQLRYKAETLYSELGTIGDNSIIRQYFYPSIWVDKSFVDQKDKLY